MPTTMPTKLDDLAALALSRFSHLNLASNATTKLLRSSIDPGEYEGETTLTIKYNIKLGEDHEALVNAAAPWKALALALLSKVNAGIRERTLRELLCEDGTVDPACIKAEADVAVREVLGTTRKVVAGKLTGKVEVV